MLKRFGWLFGLALLAGSGANAAQIQSETHDGITFITVDGEFLSGDDGRFKNVAIAAESAVVIFNSTGGLVQVGIEIGKTIAIKGFHTAVLGEHLCASSCGLAWLAGRKRLLSSSSKVGFHAVFTDQYGRQDVSSAGNALVGSYLQQLNLNPNVIIYATASNPASMQWLTAEDAERIGLDVTTIPEPNSSSSQSSNVPVPFGKPANEQASIPAPQPAVPQSPQRTWHFFDYTDLPGYDLPGMPLKLDSAVHCQKFCVANDRCTAFTFNSAHNACFLKGMAAEALQFSGAVSGYYGAANDVTRIGRDFGPSIAFRTSKNVEIVGKPFAQLKNSNLAACQDQCVVTPTCQSFNFYRNGMCVMFDVRKRTRGNLTSTAGARTN